MKTMTKIGLYGLSTGLAVFLAGCGTEKIMVDYAMPARKVADVSKVDTVSLKVEANVNGNMAGSKKLNEALIRQMISARLYKGGYYRVTDGFWGDKNAPDHIAGVLAKANESGHPYASYSSGGAVPASEICPKCGTICPEHREQAESRLMKVKAELEIKVDLDLDVNEIKESKKFELVEMPWTPVKVKQGMPPASAPNMAAAVKTPVEVPVTLYKTVAKGKITAKFNGVDGGKSPVVYTTTIDLPVVKAAPKPEKKAQKKEEKSAFAAVGSALNTVADDVTAGVTAGLTGSKKEADMSEFGSPSQLDVLAEVLSPAIAEIVADISPYTVQQELVAIKGGDKRVVTLLNAQAFREVVTFVTELARTDKAVAADYENMGIALEATAKYDLARKAFKKALAVDPEKPSETAKAGLKRVEKVLAANDAIAASGAKKNADTKFKAAK